MQLGLVQAGLAAALLPALTVRGAGDTVATLAVEPPASRWIISVVRSGGGSHPAVAAFREELGPVLAELLADGPSADPGTYPVAGIGSAG